MDISWNWTLLAAIYSKKAFATRQHAFLSTSIIKGDDMRSGTRINACRGWLQPAQMSMGFKHCIVVTLHLYVSCAVKIAPHLVPLKGCCSYFSHTLLATQLHLFFVLLDVVPAVVCVW